MKKAGRARMPDAEKEARGARVKALREELKLTQDKFADAGSFPRTYMPKLESGENAATTLLMQRGLAAAVGVPHATIVSYLEGKIDVAAVMRERTAQRLSTGPAPFELVTDPLRVGASAAVLDGATEEDVATVLRDVDAGAAFATYHEVHSAIMGARAVRLRPTLVRTAEIAVATFARTYAEGLTQATRESQLPTASTDAPAANDPNERAPR